MNSEINRCAKAFGEYLLEKAESGQAIDVKEYVYNLHFALPHAFAKGNSPLAWASYVLVPLLYHGYLVQEVK